MSFDIEKIQHVSDTIQLEHATIYYEKFYTNSDQDDQEIIPIIVVHGGPGISHHYVLSLAHLADQYTVIFYDQGGCGKSKMNDPHFAGWNLEYYTQELADFIHALGYEKIYLFGHSWGAMLAVHYAHYHQDKLVKLILASPLINAQQWIQDCRILAQNLSPELFHTMTKHEMAKTTEHLEYEAAVATFYEHYFCRIPWTGNLLLSMQDLNTKIYEMMWGNSETVCTGNLKDVDLVSELSSLQIPVLLITGQYDMARPETLQKYVVKIADARLVIIPDSGHVITFEKPEAVVEAIRKFL